MSYISISQLNMQKNSGYDVKKIAKSMSSNKSSAAAMVTKGYNSYSSRRGFVKARTPGDIRYYNSHERSVYYNGTPRVSTGAPAYSTPTTSVSQNYNVSSGMGMFGLGSLTGSSLMQVMGLVNQVSQIVGTFKSGSSQAPTTNTQALSASMSTLGGSGGSLPVSASIGPYISAMTGAQDYNSLSAAITNAQAGLTALNSEQSVYQAAASQEQTELNKLNSDKATLQQNKTTAQSNYDKLGSDVNKATNARDKVKKEAAQIDSKYSEAVTAYTEAHDKTVDAQATVDSMQAADDRAGKTLNDAKTATNSAQSSYDNALKAYKDCPEYIMDAQGNKTPNPQKAQLRAQVNVAKEKLEAAKEQQAKAEEAKQASEKNLSDAKTQFDACQKAENTAKKNKDDIAKNLKDKQAEITKFETDLSKEQDALDSAKDNREDANEKYMAADDAIKNLETKMQTLDGAQKLLEESQRNISDLTGAITENKARLDAMPKPQTQAQTQTQDKAQDNTSAQWGNSGTRTGWTALDNAQTWGFNENQKALFDLGIPADVISRGDNDAIKKYAAENNIYIPPYLLNQ